MSPQQVQGSALVGAEGAKPPEALKILLFFYFTFILQCQNGPKIDAFLPGYCSRNYKNWQTKNISENNFYILHKLRCYKSLIGRSFQIQLGVWGRCEPPSKPWAALWWGPGGDAPGSSDDTSFYSTKYGPKIDAFLPGYCSRNYKNWQTKNISENNFNILHKRGC